MRPSSARTVAASRISADAIAWELGEQSARILRGTRMEDVIFAGTHDRKATGMAEVSLTLVDPDVYDGEVPAEPEIEIENEIPGDDWDEAALRSERRQRNRRVLRRKYSRDKQKR